MVFEWAMVISNSSTELTWQHRRNGSHRVWKFTLMPLSYVTQKQKTTFCCFRFSSLSLNPNWVWVMKTGRENQAKHSKLCGSHIILKLSHMTQNSLIQTGPYSLQTTDCPSQSLVWAFKNIMAWPVMALLHSLAFPFPLSSSTLDAKSGGTSLSVEKTRSSEITKWCFLCWLLLRGWSCLLLCHMIQQLTHHSLDGKSWIAS